MATARDRIIGLLKPIARYVLRDELRTIRDSYVAADQRSQRYERKSDEYARRIDCLRHWMDYTAMVNSRTPTSEQWAFIEYLQYGPEGEPNFRGVHPFSRWDLGITPEEARRRYYTPAR